MLQLGNIYHQVKPPVPGMGYILSHWLQGSHGFTQTSQAWAIGYSPPPDDKVFLLRITLISSNMEASG